MNVAFIFQLLTAVFILRKKFWKISWKKKLVSSAIFWWNFEYAVFFLIWRWKYTARVTCCHFRNSEMRFRIGNFNF